MPPEELAELLAALGAAPAKLQTLLDSAADEQLRHRREAGEFSCAESVCHLRDIEIEGYTLRINRILKEDVPVLLDINGGRLAVERDYNEQDITDALRVFSAARQENLTTLSKLDADQLERAGTLEGIGLITLRQLLRAMREHDQGHVADIERILQPSGGPGWKD